ASLFVVDITTYGGRIDIVEKMGELLTGFDACPTAALVRNRAMSAGAFLALACDDIYMLPSSRLGAATPWLRSPEGGPANLPTKIEEKFIRDVTVSFRLLAEKKGHSGALAAGMVDPEIEVVAVRKGDDLVPMTREEYENARKGPGGRRLSEEAVIVKKGKILIMSTSEALKWGLARAQVGDGSDILDDAGLAGREVVRMTPTWGEKVARFCSSGVVVSLLITIAILALYSEMHKPSGIGGAVFLIALATFFWAQFLAGTAHPASIFIFLLGLVLILVEVFFIPGFGAAGISGIVLMLLGMVAARIPPTFFAPSKGFTLPSVRWSDLGTYALTPTLLGMVGGAVGVIVLMRLFPHIPILNRVVLKTDLGDAVVSAARAAGVENTASLLGMTGTAHTKLRPGGSARIGEKLLDVVSDGEFLEEGTPLKIVSVSGNRIVVRRA
ncbi:MAG: NfeD family protein, partial [Planctomycetota bacterium]